MAGISELTWQTLTAVVNEMKSPNQFLKRLLFGNEVTVPTETIELSTLTRDRSMAPMVKKNGEALLVSGHDATFANISPPNIRIKMPFTPSELLFNRRPGTQIYVQGNEQMSAIQRHVAIDMQVMADMVTNREEWLCAMTIQGVISYLVNDQEAYQITYPIPSANKITLSTFWNTSAAAALLEEDFTTAKRVVNDAVGLGITDAIMGAEAAVAFRAAVKAQGVINVGSLWNPGSIPLAEMFTEDGVIFMGVFCGIRVWEYARTITGDAGSAVDLIRSKYVEFVTISAAAERVMYYGAIADMDAFEAGLWQAKRFSKSWLQKDPSQMMALLHSRPLPALRRPGAGVSMKVVSG